MHVKKHNYLKCNHRLRLSINQSIKIYIAPLQDAMCTHCKDCGNGKSKPHYCIINLQATKLFIVTSATKRGGGYHPLRFSVRFKILYRVIQSLIQHCLLHKMVYLNLIHYNMNKCNMNIIHVIATRNYEF